MPLLKSLLLADWIDLEFYFQMYLFWCMSVLEVTFKKSAIPVGRLFCGRFDKYEENNLKATILI